MLKRSTLFCILTSLFFVAMGGVAPGQERDPFVWNYDGSGRSAKPGDAVPFQVDFSIPGQSYLYQDKMSLDLQPLPGFSLGPIKMSPAKTKPDPFTGQPEEIFEDAADLQTSIKVDPDVPPGEYLLKMTLSYQGCSNQLCYRLMQRELLLPLEVVGEAARGPIFTEGEGLLKQGWISALVISFVAGLVTDFTPCVLPIVPITLAFIGVRREQRRRKNFALTLVFTIAMALIYALLGLGAAALGKNLGFLFQNIYFLIFTILLYVVFALSLFGLFEIQVPLRLRNAMAKMGGSGYLGAFLAGMTTGFLAAPCVGPLIGSLLLYVTQSHDLVRGFVLLFTYGLGMGSLFLVVGTLMMVSKVHGGAFTLWVKRVLAVLMLIPAGYYATIVYHQLQAKLPHAPAPLADFWVEDAAQGFAQAVREQKKVLIDFYATWCFPCVEMEKRTFAKPEVQEEIRKNFVPIRINCTQETTQCQQMVEKYQVIGWPTLVITDSDGKVIDKAVGRSFSPAELVAYLKSLLSH